MNPPPSLSGAHLRTYHSIFQHPMSHNLAWHDVYALLRQLGEVEEEPNANFKVTCHGQSMVLSPAPTKEVEETDELMKIRDFLERSEKAPPAANAQGDPWVVVISHHEARIFRSVKHGTVAEQVGPDRAEDSNSETHSFGGFLRGQEKPAPRTFFGPVADAVKGADRILVFGSGTGRANEMDQWIAWLGIRRPELARRISGTLVVDAHHVTDAELLAKAREFFAGRRRPRE